MKKLVYFIFALSLMLLVPYNKVYAQNEYPDRFVSLTYIGHEFVKENQQTYEYIVAYRVPFKVSEPISVSDYVLYYRYDFFNRGRDDRKNSYQYESVAVGEGYSEVRFRFTVSKDLVSSRYPSGDLTYLFGSHSYMYLKNNYIEPERVMKNFVRAEPNFDNGDLVGNWGEEKYYLYLGGYVYLPDGTKRSITIMPDLIDDYFDNYDYVVLAFNLSPRTRFWSPNIYPNESISGLSYIVYDLVANSTTYYDYQGNIVVQVNGLSYIDNPQFYIPETEALDYQLKASYEEGKNEGYRQGREEGERAGKKKMQEEMQQVIDNLTEYYEKEIEKAYNRGKNDGASEQLELFGYLQVLFGEQGLGRLLRLELLPGVSLGAVIMIPLAFWLVSFIMRWFR